MSQDISNQGPIDKQLNIADNKGNVYLSKPSRLSSRFEKLKKEVENDIRYEQFIDDLNDFNTQQDGKSMPEKLKEGGFSEHDIFRAIKRKQQYWKKFEKNKFYESAQLIDLELFAKIKLNFETYVEPLIHTSSPVGALKVAVTEKIIEPILQLLNDDGYDDVLLNYTSDDILGMVYFLTGKCHLNWVIYDNI
jgi:hypothetical protein